MARALGRVTPATGVHQSLRTGHLVQARTLWGATGRVARVQQEWVFSCLSLTLTWPALLMLTDGENLRRSRSALGARMAIFWKRSAISCRVSYGLCLILILRFPPSEPRDLALTDHRAGRRYLGTAMAPGLAIAHSFSSASHPQGVGSDLHFAHSSSHLRGRLGPKSCCQRPDPTLPPTLGGRE